MKSEIKTGIIFGLVIASAIGILSIVFTSLEQSPISIDTTQKNNDLQIHNIDKSKFKIAPKLVGIENYINTSPAELENKMEGKVVLYDIWTYSCINCIRTIPYVTAWSEKYADDGLLVIGIHSPEFEFEKDFTNVEMAVKKYGIKYPVVLDNEMETWKAFENRYWPRKYIADHEGYIRYDHIGEGSYEETEKVIQQLLEERAAQMGLMVASAEPLVEIESFEHTNFRTPELYFGYKFAQNRNQLGNPEGFKPNNTVDYSFPESIQQNFFYLEGTWKNLQGGMELISESGSIRLPFYAKEVNLVASNDAVLEILLDGHSISSEYSGNDVSESGVVIISEPDLYNIVNSESAGSHLLEIKVTNQGFNVFTLTFG